MTPKTYIGEESMPVDRVLWRTEWFKENESPPFQCPTCYRGVLEIDRDSTAEAPTATTRRCSNRADWEQDFWEGRFCCLLKCTNRGCGESVSMVGHIKMAYNESNGAPAGGYYPLYSAPSLHLLPIPPQCPADVAAEIVTGCGLFWCDRPGGMNHLRKAVELIMDHVNVPRRQVVVSGGSRKYKMRSLHNRIEVFRLKNPGLADRLEAVKWLGNEGSHGDQVGKEDFFNALDLLEDFVQEHFQCRGKTIQALTRRIIKKKGSA